MSYGLKVFVFMASKPSWVYNHPDHFSILHSLCVYIAATHFLQEENFIVSDVFFCTMAHIVGPFPLVIGETSEDDPESRIIAPGMESNRIFYSKIYWYKKLNDS